MVPDGNHVINPIPMNQVRVEVMVMGRHKPVTHDVKVATPQIQIIQFESTMTNVEHGLTMSIQDLFEITPK